MHTQLVLIGLGPTCGCLLHECMRITTLLGSFFQDERISHPFLLHALPPQRPSTHQDIHHAHRACEKRERACICACALCDHCLRARKTPSYITGLSYTKGVVPLTTTTTQPCWALIVADQPGKPGAPM